MKIFENDLDDFFDKDEEIPYYEKSVNLIEKPIEEWLKENLMYLPSFRYNINNNDTIDVDGNVILFRNDNKKVKDFPYYIQFNKVSGYFFCKNENITSMKGFPFIVGNDFECRDCNKLESLLGCPEKVSGQLILDNCNNLKSLEGISKECNYICINNCNSLESLEGIPQNFNGNFKITNCKNLKTLKGCPSKLRNFSCFNCSSLENFIGGPSYVEKSFICENCSQIASLEGFPKECKGYVYIQNTKKLFTKNEIKEKCKTPLIRL